MITGHRGAVAIAPENTLIAIQKVAESGIKWVEVDTQLSADNIPVIIHDQSVKRTTNGTANVRDLTLDQLKALDAGSWFSNDFTGETIPTLKDTLITCMEGDLSINLELKAYSEDEIKPLVEKVVETIKSLDFPIEKLLFSSFSEDALAYCQALYPEARRGWLIEDKPTYLFDMAKNLNLYSLHVSHSILTEAFAKSVKQSGLKLMVWTLNDLAQFDKYRQWGVDNIITDKSNEYSDLCN